MDRLLHLLDESLAGLKLQDLGGWNFNLLSRPGIAAFTLGPYPNTERPEAYQCDLVTAYQRQRQPKQTHPPLFRPLI